MISFALQMTTQPLYHTKPQYLWCHIHLRHENTAPVLDITPTVSLSSDSLHWHLTLLYDITPTFCVTSYELYIRSHPILMSSHYSTYDITASIYETTSRMRATYTLNMWYQSPYMGHHTYSIDNITPNLFMTSHSPYVWHRLHYRRHHMLTFWPLTTILRTSHPLY